MGNSYIDEREKGIQKLCEGIKQMNVNLTGDYGWIDFNKQMPKEGQRIIIAENGYGAFDTYFEFDKDADYSKCMWCLWPF